MPRDFMCSRCSSSRSWKTASSKPPGRTLSSNARAATSPAALGSAGYCIDTRANEPAGNTVSRASPQTHSTATPARFAAALPGPAPHRRYRSQ